MEYLQKVSGIRIV